MDGKALLSYLARSIIHYQWYIWNMGVTSNRELLIILTYFCLDAVNFFYIDGKQNKLHWPIIYTLFNLVMFSRDKISLTYHQVSIGFWEIAKLNQIEWHLFRYGHTRVKLYLGHMCSGAEIYKGINKLPNTKVNVERGWSK